MSTDDFDQTMKTNLYALHWIVQAAAPHLPPGASVITTASNQAYDPSPILLDYATTKAGIVVYTKALSQQLIKKPFQPALLQLMASRKRTAAAMLR